MKTIIDVRLRPPAGSFLNMTMFKDKDRTGQMTRAMGMQLPPSVEKESVELMIAEMNSVGNYTGCVSALKRGIDPRWGWIENKEVYEIVNQYPDHLIGIGSIALDATGSDAALEDIDRCVEEYGFKAIVIEPGTLNVPMYADDRRLYPVYAKCADMKIPVFLLVGGNGGPDVSYSDPVHVEHVAIDMPDLKIVVLHGAWPWVTQILHVAFRRPNIFISPDMYMTFPGSDQYIKAANSYLGDRLLYGTSYPFAPIVGYFENYQTLGIQDEHLDKILYKNAKQLLDL